MVGNHEPWLSAIKNDPRTEEQMRADHDRKISAMKEPNPNRAPLQGPREYLKIKYMGDCKCGNCQLVPPVMIEAWALQIDAQSKILREAERFMSYFANETGGHFSGPGTPTTCLAQIRAVLGAVGNAGSGS